MPDNEFETKNQTPPRRRRRRRVLALLLGLSVVSLGAGAMTLAIFTDSDASTGTFASGTIDITSSPTIAFTLGSMMPGDDATRAMTIANAGTGDLRYAMSATASNVLGSTLTLTVKALGTSCAAFDGATILAATTLNGAGIGSSLQGADPGDRVLAAATSEVLCFRVSLPIGTGNALQGASSSATFTFDAEQTANN